MENLILTVFKGRLRLQQRVFWRLAPYPGTLDTGAGCDEGKRQTSSLTIAAAQSSSVPGDVESNVARHLTFAALAVERGVQLLVFPELSLTGYELTLARANALLPENATLEPLRQIARWGKITITAGAPVPGLRGAVHIGALVFRPDGSVTVHTKVHVHSSESHVFQPGSGGAPFPVASVTVALAICADVSNPQHAASAAAAGAKLYAAGAMIDAAGYPNKAKCLTAAAREHQMAVLLANYSGRTGGELSAGQSAIWQEDGSLVAASGETGDTLVIGVRKQGAWRGTVLTV